MTDIRHRFVETNGLRMHIAEAGSGPPVLLLHGFPECWYSWRHQLVALAEAGFHAIAPDQRGYARTGGPAGAENYTIMHLVGDVVGLIGALGPGGERPVVVGHDWGAPVAWHTALLRPDLVRGVAALSVPHRPRTSQPPLRLMRGGLGENFYMVTFQRPEAPEAEFERDVPDTFRRMLYALSGDAPDFLPFVPEGGGFLDVCPAPDKLPPWLTEDDIATFTAEFEPAGFTGPVNWYRNLDRNWELTAAWHRVPITPPALFMVGDRDLSLAAPGTREKLLGMRDYIPGLRDPVLLPGCGHWIQQERPEEVSTALIGFIGSL